MKPVNAKRQRGAALLALLAVFMLGASWLLVSQLNAETGAAAAIRKSRNAEVLNRAKQALIGYVAAQAAKAYENYPGALPCPEAAGYFDSPTQEGQASNSCTLPKVGRFPWRSIGTEKLVDASGEPLWYVVSPGWAYTSGDGPVINSNSVGQLTVDGTATTPVASPGVVNASGHGFSAGDSVSFTTGGTLPTGITAGTPYYVIAAGLSTNEFRIAATVGGSAINFTGTAAGTHNVHRNLPGAANSVVALIIAPGPAFSVASATGCAAKSQARPTTGTPDWSNYLECENATYPTPDASFVTTGPSGSFNDQVIKVTVADVMPAIEAAIANRIEREILPALQTVYTAASWGFAGTNPILPFAAPFASPGPGTGTSNYHGASGTYAGLLPFNQMRGCTVSTADPRCTSTVLTWSKGGNDVQTAGSGTIRTHSTCSWQSTTYVCTGEYLQPSISVAVPVKIANVAGGLRTINLTNKVTCQAVDDVGNGIPIQTVTCSVSYALQSDGSVIITVSMGALPDISASGWGTYANYKVSIDDSDATVSPIFGDHALLSTTDPATCPSYGCTAWFARNEWYRFLYYAVSPSNTAARLAAASPAERSCSLVGDCLTLTTNTTPSTKSALLVLAGRSINGRTRPSATLADYFEFGNATGAYERQTITPVAAAIQVDSGAANAYAITASSLAAGATVQFRAINANTGTSTLTTTATGTRNLLNLDGSNLAASTIQANAVVQATWDGTQFLISKRPFNDRVVAISGN
jgi:hypothetical protein